MGDTRNRNARQKPTIQKQNDARRTRDYNNIVETRKSNYAASVTHRLDTIRRVCVQKLGMCKYTYEKSASF